MPANCCISTRRLRLLLACVILSISFLAPAQAAKEASLDWDANAELDVAGYRLYFGTASGRYTETVDVGRRTSAKVPNLQEGNTYYFVVRAYNTDGVESLPSNEAAFTAPSGVEPHPVSFSEYRGNYSGSIVEGAPGTNASISIDLSGNGSFTGRVVLGSVASTLRGKLSREGDLVTTFTSSRQPHSLALHLDTATRTIAATLSGHNGEVLVNLSTSPFSDLNKTVDAGKYTMVLGQLKPAAGSPQHFPQGSGFATLTITPDGRIRGIGKLSDGQAFSLNSKLKADSRFDVYSLIYRTAQGLLAGPIQIRDTPEVSDADGTLFWTKPSQRSGRYRDGFSGTVPGTLSVYQRGARSESPRSIFPLTAANIILSGGDLPAAMNPVQKSVALGQRNDLLVLNPGADRLQLKIKPTTGLIHGTYIHPVDHQIRSVHGALLLKQGRGAGFFSGSAVNGQFEISGRK